MVKNSFLFVFSYMEWGWVIHLCNLVNVLPGYYLPPILNQGTSSLFELLLLTTLLRKWPLNYQVLL